MLKWCWSRDFKGICHKEHLKTDLGFWPEDTRHQLSNYQSVKDAYKPAEAGRRAGGNSERGKCHKGTRSISTIVWMLTSGSSPDVLSTGFLTNSTCLTPILTGFLTDKDTEIAEMLRQYSTARDMSHGHGIMSRDRGIQAGWPLRLSKGTHSWTLTPWSRTHLAKSDMIRVLSGWFSPLMFEVPAMLVLKSCSNLSMLDHVAIKKTIHS